MKSDIREIFERLRQEKWNTDEYGRRIDTPSGVDIFLVLQNTKPAFRFVISQNDKKRLQSITPRNGFELCFEERGEMVNCFIVSRENNNLDIFLWFISDLVKSAGAVDPEMAINSLIKRIVHWASFFDKYPNGVLCITDQVGLYGELYFIQLFLDKGFPEIISKWKGPESSTKDFVFDKFAVEIKTTKRDDNNRIRISDENQLDNSGFDKLILCYLIISEDPFDGYTIPELVEHIRESLSHSRDFHGNSPDPWNRRQAIPRIGSGPSY